MVFIYSTFTVLLNPDFNNSKNFLPFSVGKVTTVTFNFMTVICNSNPVGAIIAGGSLLLPAALTVVSAKAQFLDQVKINSISQLINGISKFIQKLIKCFSGITTSALFIPTLSTSSSPS